MNVEIVNLYECFSAAAPANGAGILTCYTPDLPANIDPKRRRPAVLILPGGAYAYCSAREMEPVALRYLARGWSAFVLEYTCAPHPFPVALREAAMAMGYIRRNAHRLGIGTNMVAAVGFSAGGHLCGTLGTLFDCPEVADLGTAEELRPDALGLHYPVAVSWGNTHALSFRNISGGDEMLAARLSLDRLARRDMPPTFLWHTRDDGSVPCRNALLLACAMEEQGVEYALHIYRHGPHGLSMADETVYPTHKLPEISDGISNWFEAEMAFFRECGLKIQDLEEKA